MACTVANTLEIDKFETLAESAAAAEYSVRLPLVVPQSLNVPLRRTARQTIWERCEGFLVSSGRAERHWLMTWVAIDSDLPDNPKALALAETLGLSDMGAVGHLTALLGAVGKYRPAGDLTGVTDRMIEKWARWSAGDGRFAAYYRVWFMDGDLVHDWDHFNGKAFEKREESRARSAKWREAQKLANAQNASPNAYETHTKRVPNTTTVPYRTVPDLTLPTSSKTTATTSRTSFAAEPDEPNASAHETINGPGREQPVPPALPDPDVVHTPASRQGEGVETLDKSVEGHDFGAASVSRNGTLSSAKRLSDHAVTVLNRNYVNQAPCGEVDKPPPDGAGMLAAGENSVECGQSQGDVKSDAVNGNCAKTPQRQSRPEPLPDRARQGDFTGGAETLGAYSEPVLIIAPGDGPDRLAGRQGTPGGGGGGGDGQPVRAGPDAGTRDAAATPAKLKSLFVLPEWVQPDPWAEYGASRKRLKAPLTPGASKRTIDDLTRFREQGFDPNRLLVHAADKGWKGIYLPKNPDELDRLRAVPAPGQAHQIDRPGAGSELQGDAEARYQDIERALARHGALPDFDPPTLAGWKAAGGGGAIREDQRGYARQKFVKAYCAAAGVA